jgi:stage V sporulation protein AA
MNFHADVSMLKVHQRIYEMMTGKETEKPYFLQIPYSIGIGAGMVLFFNHLFKKKFNEEPSPLEVEMFMYQENVNHYVITNEYSKLQEKQGGAEQSDERSR